MPNTQTRRAELDAAFKQNQHDIYVLNAHEMAQLWAAEQKSKGRSPQQIEASFLQLTAIPLATMLDQYGREFGGSAIAAGADTKMLAALAMDMKRSGSIFGRYYVQTQGGKQYLVFKGRAGLRQVLTGTRYLANNTKVMSLGVGGQALKESAKGGLLISVVFSLSINSLTWLFKDEFRWTDWLATVSTDILKAVIASAAGYAAAVTAAAFTSIAVIPLAMGLVVAIGIAWFLYQVDQHYGITSALIEKLENTEERIKQDISAGFYYVVSAAGHAVRRQLALSVRSYLNSLRRPGFW